MKNNNVNINTDPDNSTVNDKTQSITIASNTSHRHSHQQ